LPPRASLGAGLRCAAAAAKAGAAALGLAVVVFSESPEAVLGLLAVVLLVVGGATWRAPGRSSILVPILVSLGTVVLARLAAGPAAAALAALLLALGAILRVRLWEGVVGLATFGVAVALLGGARVGLILAFWLVGLAIVALRLLMARARSALLSGLRERSRGSPS